MTTPTVHDQPDFQRTVSAADIKVFSFNGAQNLASVVYGRFFVGNLPHLFVKFFSSGFNATINLAFYSAASGGTFFHSRGITVTPTQGGVGTFTCLGPYVEIQVDLQGTPSNVLVEIWQELAPTPVSTSNGGNNILVRDTVVIGAGATVVYDAVEVRWGWGQWFAHMEAATTYFIKLMSVDVLGVNTLVDAVGLGIAPGSRFCILPARPMRIVATNFDGVAHNINLSINTHTGPF